MLFIPKFTRNGTLMFPSFSCKENKKSVNKLGCVRVRAPAGFWDQFHLVDILLR